MDAKEARKRERFELVDSLMEDCDKECERTGKARPPFFMGLAAILILNLRIGAAGQSLWPDTPSPVYNFFSRITDRIKAFCRNNTERNVVLADWLQALLKPALSPIYEKIVNEKEEAADRPAAFSG